MEDDGAVIGSIILAIIYLVVLYFFFRYAAIYLLIAAAGLMAVGALFVYVRSAVRILLLGDREEDVPSGDQPAFKLYFYRKAYIDYRQIIVDTWRELSYWVRRLAGWGTVLFDSDTVWFTWPLGVVYFVAFAPAAAISAAACILMGAFHLLLMGVLATVTVVTAGIFRGFEYISMATRGIFLACPHADCYRRISLPLYACPKCRAEHSRLIPGSYGVFTRKCQCGKKLPTLFLFGRNRLPSYCPHESCKRPLDENLGVIRNAHIPIVGGPSAGKTTYLIAGMMAISERTVSRKLTLKFDDNASKLDFERSRERLRQGAQVLKTVEFDPNAFITRIENNEGQPVLLHVYDTAGELFDSDKRIQSHNYYSYAQGLLFLIDPFSVPRVASEKEEKLRALSDNLKPSSIGPQEVYDRMVTTLRSFTGRQRRALQQRIAVVLTKCDALNLGVELQGLAEAQCNSLNGEQGDTSAESLVVKKWLCDNDQGNLVRGIEHDFKGVRFFYCSAVESLGKPDAARNTLRPLTWLLEGFGVETL